LVDYVIIIKKDLKVGFAGAKAKISLQRESIESLRPSRHAKLKMM
jgi:hypothetical protein